MASISSMAKEDVLNFLDLLDLDEEVIDHRLKSLMSKKTLTIQQLSNSLHLIQYKLLINSQEGTECDNNEEIDFVANLLIEMSEENIDYVCKITNAVLRLNSSSLTIKAEHLLQQTLSDLQSLTDSLKTNQSQDLEGAAILKLKVCESIMDAALHVNVRLSIFLETPIEDILDTTDDKLKSHFLMNTVPRLFNVLAPCEYGGNPHGLSILDRIWIYVQKLSRDKNLFALRVLVALSEFYLPTADSSGDLKYKSEIIFLRQFWQIILLGMHDLATRKNAIYLAKRAIDCFVNERRNARITSKEDLLIFHWDILSEKEHKSIWDHYFILIESLEEKQSNIVIPSLQLFDAVQSLGHNWLNIAFNIGLSHPNIQVKLKCIEYRMKAKLNNVHEAQVLLEALNDINLYANPTDVENVILNIQAMCQEDTNAVIQIFNAFSSVHWSPVPLYYLTMTLSRQRINAGAIVSNVCDILKITCNNVLIRKMMYREFLKFLSYNCNFVTKEQFLQIMSVLQTCFEHEDAMDYCTIIAEWLKNNTNADDKADILKCISEKFYHIDVILAAEGDKKDLACETAKKFENINDVINRQYCDKLSCFHIAAHLMLLYNNTTEVTELYCIRQLIEANFNTLTRYISELLLNENVTSDDEIRLLDDNLYPILKEASKNVNSKQAIQHIIKTSLTILKDQNSGLARKVLSITILKVSLKAYQEENMLLTDFFYATKCIEISNHETDGGTRSRLLNKVYQTLCEVVCLLITKKPDVIKNLEFEMLAFISNAIECGGYGCLQWVLKLMRVMLPTINATVKDYNIRQFIDRMWKEIGDLKSNQEYTICIEEFINILLDLMRNTTTRDDALYAVIIHYCKKIIEMGEASVKPLLILTRKMSSMPMTPDVGAVYILHEILLSSPVPRKDQRITNVVTLEILDIVPKWDVGSHILDLHSPHHVAAGILLNVTDKEAFKTIFERMRDKLDTLFKNKQRYHANSHHHRVLLAFLQHTLFVLLLQPETIDLSAVKWYVEMLRKIPHQPSVKACLEWIIALYICLKQLELNEANLDTLELKTVPLLSQFMIPFLVLKHRIKYGTHTMEEYTFVMEYLLTFTMGQQYSIRLHAQYLASQLHLKQTDTYDYIMKIIHKNFAESKTERNYNKLQKDLMVNRFDIVHFLTPMYIYHLVPNELGDETGNLQIFSAPKVAKCEAYLKENNVESAVTAVWFCVPKNDDAIKQPLKEEKQGGVTVKPEDGAEALGAIQKKYTPWRNMTDVNGFEGKKRAENTSGLIVVASLIDKLPNLGGLARTSEVFGVQTYVIDSLRHLQDRQFQGLSLSAERWVDIVEVRPGSPLKQYLLRKRSEGYTVVAAEQTSASVALQAFKFPKKTVLLLGHEKEGVPSDLLLLADQSVEVPQQGFVRSLNVHVTAALFVWEYTRQHTLPAQAIPTVRQ